MHGADGIERDAYRRSLPHKGSQTGKCSLHTQQTDTERHDYKNLIVMCPTHHIDDDEEAYTDWSVFFVLQAMYGRTALLLTNSYKERKLVNWREDSGCDQLLRAILPAQVAEHVKGLQVNGLRTPIDYLEGQFLAEAGMNKPHA
jgi:hypothetical protein